MNHRPPPFVRPLVPKTERQILARSVAAELSFVRAFVTLALPIAVGSWNPTLGLILAIPCIAYLCWQVTQSWRRFVRGHKDA